MASLRVNKTGFTDRATYFYEIREGAHDTKIDYKSGFATEEEAYKVGSLALRDYELEKDGLSESTSLYLLVRYYRRLRVDTKNIAPATLEKFDYLEKFVQEYFDMPIGEIKASYYQKVFTELGKSRSSDYLRRLNYFIRNGLKLAKGDGVEIKDFTDGLVIISQKEPKDVADKYINKASEIERLEKTLYFKALDEYEKTATPLILYFLLATGLRFGELLSLKWSDVKTEKGNKSYLDITKRLRSDSAKDLKIVKPKSVASIRQIPLSKNQTEYLKGFKSRQAFLNLENKIENADDYIFQHPCYKNKLPTNATINGELQRIIYDLGIEPEDLTVYGLRHSRAAYLITKGVPREICAIYLGHTLAVFEDTYRHLLNEKKNSGLDYIRKLDHSVNF